MNGLHIPLAAALTVFATTVCCGACLQLFLKSKLNSDCLVGGDTSAINTQIPYIADSALVFAALSFTANVACLLFRTRSERGWALARSIFSRNFGISIILGDLDEELVPPKRKCSYCFFVLCSTLEAIGSYFWGNSLAKQVSISVGSFNFVIDNQITSCMTSVLAISIHFLFVSARSQTGRAWYYAPLRFELVLTDESELTNSLNAHAADHHLLTEAAKGSGDSVCEELRGQNAKNCNPCFYMGVFLDKIQEKNTSRCQVFSIPCTTNRDMGSSSPRWLEAKRPFFNLSFLRPLHRLAVAHPNCYIGFAALTAFASFGCSFLRDFALGGMLCFFLNSFAFILGLGFFSCKRHNLDRVAACSVVRSFRFLLITALLLAFFGLQVRFVHLGIKSPWQAAAIGILAFPFCLCALSDCSPSVSAFTQICISATFGFVFGWWTYEGMRGVAYGEMDCFIQMGSYKICDNTFKLSVCSNLSMLYTQALISRIFAPGVSNFVNSSVSILVLNVITAITIQYSHTLQIIQPILSDNQRLTRNDSLLAHIYPPS